MTNGIQYKRKAIKTEIDKLKQEIKAKRNEFDLKVDEYYQSERDFKKVTYENTKIKRDFDKKQREEKQKEIDEERKQYHPYENELTRCAQLISYLENLLAKHNEHTAKQANEAVAAASKQNEIKVPEDVKLIGKKKC